MSASRSGGSSLFEGIYNQAGFFHVWFTVSDGELGDIETVMITVNEVDEDGCSCGTISAGSPESLKIEQLIGFFLPFLTVFLTIVILKAIAYKVQTGNSSSTPPKAGLRTGKEQETDHYLPLIVSHCLNI